MTALEGRKSNEKENSAPNPKKKATRKRRPLRAVENIETRLLEEEEDDPPVDSSSLSEEIPPEQNPRNAISDKDFVLVSITTMEGKQKENFYVGQVVTDLDGDEFEVNFLRKRLGKNLIFTFPSVPDVSNVPRKDICRVLEVKTCKRDRYPFFSLVDFSNLF